MNANDIVLEHQRERVERNARLYHSLAESKRDRKPNDMHAVHFFAVWQRAIIVGRENGDVMPASSESARKPFDIDGQAADVRAIIGQGDKDFHLRYGVTETYFNLGITNGG